MEHNKSSVRCIYKTMLKEFVKSYRWKYFSGMLFLVALNLLQLLVPKITGNVINSVVDGDIPSNKLLGYSSIVLLISFLIFFFHFLSRFQLISVANLYDYLIRKKIFKHLESLSMSFFNKVGVGDIMALSANDLSAVRMAMGRGFILTINTFVLIASSIIIMSKSINFRLTILVFIPFPILVFVMLKFGRIINKRFLKVQESFADITKKAQENICGIRVIKSFAQEENEINSFKQLNQMNYIYNMRLVKIQGLFLPLIDFLSNLIYMITLLYGGILVVRGEMSLGDFVAFNSYVGIILRPLSMFGKIITSVQRGMASMGRVQNLLEVKPEIIDESNGINISGQMNEINSVDGKIEFKNVTFSYTKQAEPALKNINFVIESGKTVALIGKVGSGKSTIANLLLRLYDIEQGELLIDGRRIRDYTLKALRESIGYVPQENFLFSQTIKENIAFSEQGYSIEEIETSAKISQVYNNIIEFPNKFDTVLGERGVNISGGQKQRVSIARALIKKPKILILDDCLSAVDTDTEKRILDKLRTVMKGCTSIIIAHRISTIMDADEIFVLDEGEIIERGSHEHLLGLRGVYSSIYQRQQLEDKIKNTDGGGIK